MEKFQKIKVNGKNHSDNALCHNEDIFTQTKEHNLQIINEVAERSKRVFKRKTTLKVAAILALLILLIIMRLFLT